MEEEKKETVWILTRKVVEGDDEGTELNASNRCFTYSDLPRSEEHERQIPKFKQELKGTGVEIFAMQGHQFMTSEGVYRIVKKISDTQYE